MHLTAVPAKRGVDTVKLVGPVPWCDGLTVDERWDAGRIARNASGKEPAFLFMVDDAPLQRKLGFYEVFE